MDIHGSINVYVLHVFLAKEIPVKVQKLSEKGILCKLKWSPGHAKIPGNMGAHSLTQLATSPKHYLLPLESLFCFTQYSNREQIHYYQDPTQNQAKVGRFIKSFDKALLGKHTNIIYNGRTKKQSQILCQLRTGICRLNSYLAQIQAVDSDQCRYNHGRETVDHFLLRCPRWSNLRYEFKRLAANRWGGFGLYIRGLVQQKERRPVDTWAPSKAAISATINFVIATGLLEDRSNEYDEETEDESSMAEEEEDT